MERKFFEESMGRRINFLFRISLSHIRSEMKKLGIGAGDYAFLIVSYLRPGSSQDELSRFMHVDKSYTARAVARLEKMGLMERRSDPDEYRVKRVFLTKQALDMEDAFFGVLKEWNTTLVRDIPAADLKIVRRGLDKMMENACLSLYGEPPEPIIRN